MARSDNFGPDSLAAALRSVSSLGGGVSPIQPIAQGNPNYRPTAGTYEGGPRAMLAQKLSDPGKGGGGGGQGGGGAGSGLEKLGGGIAQAMKAIAAKRQAQQADLAAVNALGLQKPDSFGSPPSAAAQSASPPSPFGTSPADAVISSPYSPSPIGTASPVPTFSQPDIGTGEMGSSIGQGGELPTFARGQGQMTAGAGDGPGFVKNFLTGIKAGEGTPYSGFSPTRAIGAYGLTGDFIKQYAPGAGLPTDRASYMGNAALQDQLATHAATQMYNKYGSWPAVANAWLTGSPTATTSAPGNMSPRAYDAKVMNAANAAPSDIVQTPSGATGADAYAATAPSAASPSPSYAGNEQPVIPGQGNPHQPGFDPSSVPFINTPLPGEQAPSPDLQPPTGPQGFNDVQPLDQQSMLAMALAQNNPIDFGNFGFGLGGLFG